MTNKVQQFYQILDEKRIRPVYQAIVSLEDGTLHGYEALSRITLENTDITTEELFRLAEQEHCLFECEELCRSISLKHAAGKLHGRHLFLNVDPNVIHDEKFRAGVTAGYLEKCGLQPSEITFEITERNSAKDIDTFHASVEHYKKQQYKVAIDDFGMAYSGVNRILMLEPHYIKIDISLIRGIDASRVKQSLIRGLVAFCRTASIRMIAEGIETEAELSTLMEIGVGYGQGYLLQRPQPDLQDLAAPVKALLARLRKSRIQPGTPVSLWSNIGSICCAHETFSPETPGYVVCEYIRNQPAVSQATIVDSEGKVLGVLTRSRLLELFGGKFGYSLYGKRCAGELMTTDFLEVAEQNSVEIVSQMAMSRPQQQLYDDVVVTKGGRYSGLVSVKKMLETVLTIQVHRAVEANPLTGLPGNQSIQQRIQQCLQSEHPFSIAYLDLDNFKAYNDTYSFSNGDKMIRAVVSAMQECCRSDDFLGHIGGDDFVMISSDYALAGICAEITANFSERIRPLYTETDWARGYIESHDRSGAAARFPIASLSIAVVTNASYRFRDIAEYNARIVQLKAAAKAETGHSIQCL